MATPAPETILTRVTTERGRYYITPEGRQLPSVTTILGVIGKPGLDNWKIKTERESVIHAAQGLVEELERRDDPAISAGFAEMLRDRLGRAAAFQRVMNQAGQIGTSVHALIEWSLRHELGERVTARPVGLDERGLCAFMAYEDWRRTVDLKPLAVERELWSATHGYAGTMDLLAELTIDDARVVAVIDWKTGGIYNEALLQSAAYMHAAIEMGLAAAPLQGVIVHLPKTAKDKVKVRTVSWDEMPKKLGAFLGAKELWEELRSDDRRVA
jgi:hypothetical protein